MPYRFALEGLPWTKTALSRPMTTVPMPPPWRPGLPPCAPSWRSAGWTASSCRIPTSIRASICPPCAERLAWLTSFTGSAGAAVVLKDKAAIFVDGRYTLQVRAQTDTSLFEPRDLVAEGPQGWIPDHLPQGAKLGFDPWLSTAHARGGSAPGGGTRRRHLGRLRQQSHRRGLDRPPFAAHGAGGAACAESGGRGEQRQARPHRRELAEIPCRRGEYSPCAIPSAGCSTFAAAMCRTRLSCWPSPFFTPTAAPICSWTRSNEATDLAAIWATACVWRRHPNSPPRWTALKGKTVIADPATAAAAIFDRLNKAGAKVKQAPDPCQLPKACKNPLELEGTRKAHIRDGAALSRFLCWFAREAPERRPDRNRRGAGAGRVPPRHQLSLRPVLRFHFRRRRQRRHRALPRHPLDQCSDPAPIRCS